MGIVRNILRAYEVGRKQYESHKDNQNTYELRIQETKGTNFTVIDHSGAQSWSWLLCMTHVVSILNCMAHRYLSWSKPHEDAYGFTPDVSHLMEFELWEPIIIIDDKNHFPEP